MDQNRDWKPVAALVLAALALFVALGGARNRGNDQVSAVPQQIIVQPAAPPSAQTGGAVAPQAVLPVPPVGATQAWGGWVGGGPGGGPGGGHRIFFPLLLFPLLLFAGLALLAFKVAGRRRYGGGGPGWYGRPWGPGPGPGPQGPPQGQPYEHYQQYPQYSQYPQGYGPGQPYGGGYYPQGQQPQPPQQPPQGQPPQANAPADDAHGDITRPQGNGN